MEAPRLKLWRFGRMIIDSGLNTVRMDYDEAVDLETREIGFVRETMFHEFKQEFGV